MSRMLPASMSLVVTSLSALLGSGLPDGWLWTTMIEFALARSALCVNIDVASTKEANYEIFPSSEVKYSEKSLAA